MILIKTEAGQQAFKGRSPLFSARQRTAFIMFDGKKSVEQMLLASASLGLTAEDVEYMVGHGFLAPAPGEAVPVPAPAADVPSHQAIIDSFTLVSPQERYQAAKPIATKLTAALGLRGFRLNLAVEGASGYEELLALLPKIKEAVGVNASEELERALNG